MTAAGEPYYYAAVAEGPDGHATWAKSEDNVRLRVGLWPHERAKGTVLVFPGRTEYVEKYGRVARELHDAGYAAAAVDWRGQGLSDRLSDDPLLGHVSHFRDYQSDVAAYVSAVRGAGLPEPFFLVAHSMGGAIGLRALIEDLPVERAVFSAPMWGIFVSRALWPVAAVLPPLAQMFRQHMRYTPGTRPTAYVKETQFQTNLLTTCPDHYAYLVRQAAADPGFALGGPSLHWFSEAVAEGKALLAAPRPSIPVVTYLGSDEGIVSSADIRRMHDGWPSGELRIVPGAKHELMMEAPQMREAFMQGTIRFFDETI